SSDCLSSSNQMQ
ncbi:unnamed protein product, partial [Allacma fusca]